MSEPVRDLAHLSHIELLTPKPEESLAYFRELLGMEVAGERGDSVYLRCFGDYETSSLKLTQWRLVMLRPREIVVRRANDGAVVL